MGNHEGKTILLVDGNATYRKLLAVKLQYLEYGTMEASCAEELEEALPGRVFDLVVSENELPGLTAEELAQKYQGLRAPLLIYSERSDAAGWNIPPMKGSYRKDQKQELIQRIHELLDGEGDKATKETAGNKNILVIEDSATIRHMLRRILEANFPGCVIREAQDGRSAMTEMSNKKVDLILTDLQMPGMDGQTFLKKLLDNPILKKKPVIVLSSTITPQLREELKGCGKVRLLQKPSSAEEISATMRELLEASDHDTFSSLAKLNSRR
jgi:two-component system chemotaxis response regulator CheY